MGEKLQVAVVGAGAVGQVLGGRLAAAGHRVRVVARESRVPDLRERGLRLRKGSGEEEAIRSAELAAGLGPETSWDYVLVAVRGEQLRDTLAGLRAQGARGRALVICTAFWGPEPEHRLEGFGETLVLVPGFLAGEEAGAIRYRLAASAVGPLEGPATPAARDLARVLGAAGVPARPRASLGTAYAAGLALALPWALAVERAGFDLAALARDRALREQAASAAREAVALARRRTGRGGVLASAVARCSSAVVAVGGRALAPLTRRGWAGLAWRHLRKIAPQDRALLADLYRWGTARGESAPALGALVGEA